MRSIAHHAHGQQPARMKFLRIIFGCPAGARKWRILFFCYAFAQQKVLAPPWGTRTGKTTCGTTLFATNVTTSCDANTPLPVNAGLRQKILSRSRSLCPQRSICRAALHPISSNRGSLWMRSRRYLRFNSLQWYLVVRIKQHFCLFVKPFFKKMRTGMKRAAARWLIRTARISACGGGSPPAPPRGRPEGRRRPARRWCTARPPAACRCNGQRSSLRRRAGHGPRSSPAR